MKKIFTCILFCSVTTTYAQEVSPATSTKMLCSLKHNDARHRYNFSGTAFIKANNTWGYDILADGKLLFHQEEMPGKPKGTGFSSKEDALKVAGFIIDLLEHPVRPAVATAKDMEQLHLL